MSLSPKLSAIILGLGVSFATIPQSVLAQQQDLSQVEIKTVPITEGIYMLVGEGGNIGLSVGTDGVFMIDDQFAPLTDKIKTAIGEITEEPIRFLINTHWHFDHTGGNENLGKSGVIIVAHDQVRERLSVDQFLQAFNKEIPATPAAGLPVITFNDTTTFYLNGNSIHTFHVEPAHTDGDSVIHFKEANVIHTGDIYFNGIYPFIDVEHGGSIEGMINAAKKILALCDDDTKLIPGHGNLSNRQELADYIQMLETVKQRVQKAVAQGISQADFIKSNPTADLDKKWGKGFLTPEQFLTIVYTDLAQ